MNEITKIIQELIKFRDDRDWAQFHDSKNLATALSIEAAELNELFLWKTVEESEKVNKARLSEELADVLIYSLLLAHKRGLNIKDIIRDKVRANAIKYPVDKAKGSMKKYNEL
ncbi:MAG: nucleotide pyrophosphohydrolase [Bacteroidetes bacterium]|nr:nucleotide pyrophosphohydrolase [Bacteroidota bacterium]